MAEIIIVVLTCTLGAFLTFEASNKFNINKVAASSSLSLAVALFFHYGPKIVSPELAHLIPTAFFGASFNGMSAEKVILKTEIIFSGIIFGILFLFITSYFNGFGGGLGITACTSVIIILGIKITYEKLQARWKSYQVLNQRGS
jgi:hypothetical protein